MKLILIDSRKILSYTSQSMSPLRIEIREPNGGGITILAENTESQPVGPKTAAKILGATQDAIRWHDGEDVGRTLGKYGIERTYNDRALLRIATEISGVVSIVQGERGLTQLNAERTSTLLDIPWEEARQLKEKSGRKGKER